MSGADEMARIMAEGLVAAERLQAEDERMAAAARGEPFWRRGDPAEVVGLAGYLPAPRRPVESYARVSVAVPGGSVEAGLERGTTAEPLRLKCAELRRIIADEALALNGDCLDEDNGAWLTAALDVRMRETFPGRAWFVELWIADADGTEEPLSQVYAPWGMPMERPA